MSLSDQKSTEIARARKAFEWLKNLNPELLNNQPEHMKNLSLVSRYRSCYPDIDDLTEEKITAKLKTIKESLKKADVDETALGSGERFERSTEHMLLYIQILAGGAFSTLQSWKNCLDMSEKLEHLKVVNAEHSYSYKYQPKPVNNAPSYKVGNVVDFTKYKLDKSR